MLFEVDYAKNYVSILYQCLVGAGVKGDSVKEKGRG